MRKLAPLPRRPADTQFPIPTVTLSSIESHRTQINCFTVPRDFVHNLIENDAAEFWTYVQAPHKTEWKKGARIITSGDKFLTTEPDHTEDNNLDNLPDFVFPAKEEQIEDALKRLLDEGFHLKLSK